MNTIPSLSKFFQWVNFGSAFWMSFQLWGKFSSLLWMWSFISIFCLVFLEVKDKFTSAKRKDK
jgi:hypothetical protein